MVAQGNALGFGIDRCALQGRRNPLRPFRAEQVPRTRSRGVAPGWHAPRRWRLNVAEFSIGENCYGPIYETGATHASRITLPVSDAVHPEIIELARRIAAAHGIEPALVCAVIEQESAWNPWAVRYEPGFLSRYVAPLYTAGKLSATEAYTRSMSWGLMQVMGQVAREFGFAGDSLPKLCDPATGVEVGCRVLAKRMARSHGDVPAALLAWNGGADPNYPAEVLARKRNYSSKSEQ
jgi:soluble lytic murein transglycosylase-like protein